MAGNDDGPEMGTHCRRCARVKDGVASTGARPLAPRDPKEVRGFGPGGGKREELNSTSLDRGRGIAKDAVLRRKTNGSPEGKRKKGK